MARKTRRHTKKSKEDVMTIPEVRRAFEHIEDFIHDCHSSGEDHMTMVKHLRKEWARVFHKELSKASAERLLEGHMDSHSSKKRHTRKRIRGGSSMLVGAPLDTQTRMGTYNYSSPGGIGQYALNGLRVGIPEIATATYVSPTVPQEMGSNQAPAHMKGGSRRGVRRSGGSLGSLLTAAAERLVGPSAPSSALFDAQSMMKGQLPVGGSPIQYQQQPQYQAGSNVKPISF